MRLSNYAFLFFLILSCSQSSKELVYPKTQKIPVIDTYFGEDVIDNYRWLEDDNSEETKRWVSTQNKVTSAYFGGNSFSE